ncbi:hypothetical protein JTB14_034089 [Gonioctena quinquepunctata]|nr:hypothetical protein JTB14_034089 [Gonioctena quinquepunctata]
MMPGMDQQHVQLSQTAVIDCQQQARQCSRRFALSRVFRDSRCKYPPYERRWSTGKQSQHFGIHCVERRAWHTRLRDRGASRISIPAGGRTSTGTGDKSVGFDWSPQKVSAKPSRRSPC